MHPTIVIQQLQDPSAEELAHIARIYTDNFPPTERDPFPALVAGIKAGRTLLLVARDTRNVQAILGFMVLNLLPDARIALIAYLAVDRAHQAQGIGRQLFLFAAEHLRAVDGVNALLWEVEPPHPTHPSDPRNRRIRFYERLGGGA